MPGILLNPQKRGNATHKAAVHIGMSLAGAPVLGLVEKEFKYVRSCVVNK